MDYGSPIETLAREAMLQGLCFLDSTTLNLKYLTGTPTALGANASLPLQLQIGSQGDFVIQMLQVTGKQAGAIVANPDIEVSLVDDSSQRVFQNSPTHILNVFGNYGTQRVPGVLPYPKLMMANSTLEVTLTDLSGVAWTYVYVAFEGFRVYYTGGTREQIFHAL